LQEIPSRRALITVNGAPEMANLASAIFDEIRQLGENSLKQLADVVIQAVVQIRRFTQETQA